MKTIFAIICNQTPSLHSHKFFRTYEAALKHLKQMAEQRKNNLGVRHFEWSSPTEFSFVLGWESVGVRFSIVELPLEDGTEC